MASLREFFSTLKVIKVDKRSSLGNDLLDDLLVLNTDRVALKDFNPDHSISLWWSDKTRRPNQQPRKKDNKDSEEAHSDSENDLILDEWDVWMDSD